MADENTRKRQRSESPVYTRRISAASLSVLMNPEPMSNSMLPSPTFHSYGPGSAPVYPQAQYPATSNANAGGSNTNNYSSYNNSVSRTNSVSSTNAVAGTSQQQQNYQPHQQQQEPHQQPHHQQQQQLQNEARPFSPPPTRFEQNIFGVRPTEDILRAVSDFIFTNIGGRTNIEIEGKLGLLVDKKTGTRLNLPVMTETIIKDDKNIRFESDMKLQQHAHFNKLLNQRVDETRRPEFRGTRVAYKHTKEVDHFYRVDGTRVRVTTNKETGQIMGVITKNRIASIDIYSPRTKLDIRISINEEQPLSRPNTEDMKVQAERHKDRLSYTQDIWSFDLTQVTTPEHEKGPVNPYAVGPPKTTPTTVTHELEVEISRPELMMAERAKCAEHKPNMFVELTHIFLGNLRGLAKRAI
ncbi:mRNA-capping enzyme subunit beta [Linderina macrospora]|uniref:mRNA-capping enzyme subunit beta n=1 Tax=Linderina macrospora TaxID=4868 RepID=A0ACC1JHL2_9FUNG|nr:mRNA-capping enzyme subunit beta [Linderina macrospora]